MKTLFSLFLGLALGLTAAEKPAVDEVPQALELAQKTLDYVQQSRPVPELAAELAALRKEQKPDAAAIRALRRKILFCHPLLDFEQLLINKRPLHPKGQKHMVDHYLGHNSVPGEGLALLRDWKTVPRETLLLKDKLPIGDARHPALSYDGRKILFSYCKEDKSDPFKQRFFIYEISVDGTGLRQITGTETDPLEGKHGRKTQIIEDFDPCYLPDGGIVFTSTRLQGHVRCAYGERYCPTFCLYRMEADGSGIRQLSFGDIAEYDPEVLPDGRLIYTRWEYIDRHDTWFQGLWTMRPDGTGVAHYYGNTTRSPCVVAEAKPIPGTRQVMALATAHHFYYTGSVIGIDPAKGEDDEAPLTRLTPEVPFPETPGHGPEVGRYAMPFPLDDTLYFVSFQEEASGQMAVYLMDRFGGKEFIHRAPGTSCYAPIPIKARPVPPAFPSLTRPVEDGAPASGTYFIQNVYQGRQPIPAGQAKFLRVNQIFDQPHDFAPKVGIVHGTTPYKILGEVPVGEDGSVSFKAPAGEPLFFQVLDAERKSIMGMRSFVFVHPGETHGCIGCHENKRDAASVRPLKFSAPQELRPPQYCDYPGGFSFARSVQPVLDRHCISCHGLKENKINLLGTKKEIHHNLYGAPTHLDASIAYLNLVPFAKIAQRNQQSFFSTPKDYGAHPSRLTQILKDHHGVKLSEVESQTISAWLDLNAPKHGSWSWKQPEFSTIDTKAEAELRRHIQLCCGEEVAKQPIDALINRAEPEKSRILLAPLSHAAGGWEQLRPLWPSRETPEFVTMRRLVLAAIVPPEVKEIAGTCGASGPNIKTRNDCRCGNCWIRLNYQRPESEKKP
ncbi:MAG: hypothetical protein RL095_3777 [Verrucomicrobiota bacterium]